MTATAYPKKKIPKTTFVVLGTFNTFSSISIVEIVLT